MEPPSDPVLRFTPTAWAKLQYFCHRGDTEIGGFSIASADDLLLIRDFITVKQSVSVVSVCFDDEAVADFFDAQVDAGRRPEQFARTWVHTHPGHSPDPSATDEETFERVFGGCEWAIMAILARGGQTYARLRFNTGPGGQLLIPVMVDYSAAFGASDHEAWEEEYQANIHPEPSGALYSGAWEDDDAFGAREIDLFDPNAELDELETLARVQGMDPDELEDLFGDETEVIV